MELIELKNKIIDAFQESKGSAGDLETILQFVEKDHAIFPFNEYEYMIYGLMVLNAPSL